MIISRWNKTAVECYERGCMCGDCPIFLRYFKNKSYKCQMKKVVLEMVKTLGKPDTTDIYENTEDI